jgi:hypothetical protein
MLIDDFRELFDSIFIELYLERIHLLFILVYMYLYEIYNK